MIHKLSKLEKKIYISHKRRINLDTDPQVEVIIVYRDTKKEYISIFKKKQEKWTANLLHSYTIPKQKPHFYDKKLKKWVEKIGKNKKVYSIANLIVEQLPGDAFNSIFLEVLLRRGNTIVSVPYAYRNKKLIFDGKKVLAKHPILNEWKRTEIKYIKKDKSLRIFPTHITYKQDLVFNGWELLPSTSGFPIVSLLEKKVDSSKNTIEFVFKNRGGHTRNTYLSFYFPKPTQILIPKNSKGYKTYKQGSRVYLASGKYGRLNGNLLEVTKESWGRNYRFIVKFSLQSTEQVGKIYFRSAGKLSREIISIPNAYSSIPTQDDGQGFPVYTIPMVN